MKNNIILIGGGGHCKSVIDVLESLNYNILGILDVAEKVGKSVLSIPIIGTDDNICQYVDNAKFLITLGFIKDPYARINLFNKVKENLGEFATVIAPTAYVSKYAHIEEGTIIMHNALINTEVRIGKNCIINTAAIIEHESIIGNQTHISTNVVINGGCNIGDRVFIGSKSVSAQGVNITNETIISANSFIKKDIIEKGIYEGYPLSKRK